MHKILDDQIIRTTVYWTTEYAEFIKEYAYTNRMSVSEVMRTMIDMLASNEITINKKGDKYV
jgi:hypothetical protein